VPELPEVETIVRDLRPILVGRSFTGVHILWLNSLRTPLPELESRLPGQRIEALDRRAKYLRFSLSGGDKLILHLKMSGDLHVLPADEPLHAHDRSIFDLDSGYQLRFRDTRKFGRIYFVNDENVVFGGLGLEPLSAEFDQAAFRQLLDGRSRLIKPLLMDQTFIAGIGNIYADESLFLAGIHPERKADSLTSEESGRLHQAIRAVLQDGITYRGSSFDAVYRGGQFQDHFRVYGRKAEPCLHCGEPIRRITVGGRGSFFCPHCQPIHNAKG
jgi:formamidopyrimidine-DNA glycosylase